jgi:hypothetical protein
MTVVRRRLIIELTQTRTPPAGAGAALEGDYSPLRARFEQAQGQALTGAEEQEYLEQHPVLARVPAHHRLFIICRQSPGHTKSYNFWVQHREVMHVHLHLYTDTHTHTHTHGHTHCCRGRMSSGITGRCTNSSTSWRGVLLRMTSPQLPKSTRCVRVCACAFACVRA